MNIQETLSTILKMVLVPILPLLTTYIIYWLKIKVDELKEKINNEKFNKYLDILHELITSNVMMVNQTFVDALKKDEIFTKENQIEAFNLVKTNVLNSLTRVGYDVLANVIEDLDTYINTEIEAAVRLNKKV